MCELQPKVIFLVWRLCNFKPILKNRTNVILDFLTQIANFQDLVWSQKSGGTERIIKLSDNFKKKKSIE